MAPTKTKDADPLSAILRLVDARPAPPATTGCVKVDVAEMSITKLPVLDNGASRPPLKMKLENAAIKVDPKAQNPMQCLALGDPS